MVAFPRRKKFFSKVRLARRAARAGRSLRAEQPGSNGWSRAQRSCAGISRELFMRLRASMVAGGCRIVRGSGKARTFVGTRAF